MVNKRIFLCLTLCLMLVSVSSCPCCNYEDPECLEKQDAAIIKISGKGFDNRYFDSLAVQKDNKVMFSSPSSIFNFNMGSKWHNVEFPVHINVLFFMHGILLKNLEFEIPNNSVLSFYNGNECEIIHDSMSTASGEIYRWEREGIFFQEVQRVNREAFIDSSRSGTVCWIMAQMNEYDNYFNCAKWKDG